MTEKVLAVHKVTGIITSVLPSEIDVIPALELATDRQVKAAHAKRQAEVYGPPAEAPKKEDNKVNTKDGADNG